MPQHCKACNSPFRGFIDGAIRDGLPYRQIVSGLATRGEDFSVSNIGRHSKHVKREDEAQVDEDIEEAIAVLKEEANRAPVTLRPAYLTITRFLENAVARKDPTFTDAVRAAEAIARIGGMDSKQRALLAFMNAGFPKQD